MQRTGFQGWGTEAERNSVESPTPQGLGRLSPAGMPPPPPIGVPGTEFRASRPTPGPAGLPGPFAQVLDRHVAGTAPWSREVGNQPRLRSGSISIRSWESSGESASCASPSDAVPQRDCPVRVLGDRSWARLPVPCALARGSGASSGHILICTLCLFRAPTSPLLTPNRPQK